MGETDGEKETLKVWSASHAGVYLGGFSVVVARDEDQARLVMRELLNEWGIWHSLEDIELTLIDTTTPNAVLLWNGDY